MIAQPHRVDSKVGSPGIRLRMFLDHRAVNSAQFGARGLEARPRSKATEDLSHPMHTAGHHHRREVVRARHDIRDDFRFRWVGNGRLEDTDDGRRTLAKPDCLPNHRRIARQRGRPEAICQHGGAGRLRPIVGRAEQPAQHRTESHHVEVRSADDTCADHARLAKTDHRETDGGKIAKCGQRLHACAEVLDFRDRKHRVLVPQAPRALADVDQAILVTVDERPQQHASDNAEDGGVGANTKRERDDDGDGQSFDPGQ